MPPIDTDLDLPMRSMILLVGLALAILLAISSAWAVVVERLWSGKPLLPARRVRPAPWGGREVFLCLVAWQAVTLAASQVLDGRRDGEGELPLVDAMAAVSIVNLVLLFVLPAILLTIGKATPADLGFRRGTTLGDAITGVVGALCLVPLVYLVQFAAILIWSPTAHPMQEMLFEVRSLGVIVLALASAVVLAPAAEELMFRGFLQGWLEARLGRSGGAGDPSTSAADSGPARGPRGGGLVALILPAAFFAGVHYGQWPAPIPLFVLAVGLGVVYRRTGGLVAPIAMHATFNGLSTMAMIVVLLAVPARAPEPEVDGPVPVPPVLPASSDPGPSGPAGAAGSTGRSHRNVESG
ncbi:CPBP family intramembrane glutamic endopeptidase [Tautonia plasticadhaerens]|uniref:CAAX amino terminal protease self-immunity n=1 Tax=Tautonia plasticadhaerens TaxID=2527974 RepID=A0A518GZX9_9BACT|nr:CPBP family intramembrane glutamic endopeptidase [Tautonia plasticadhaerens]QDV34134.1 CAAX amino terminal protease self- immunity [Tautonia plasticadhaerens]